MNNTIDYDFEDAKENSAKYVEDFFAALGTPPTARTPPFLDRIGRASAGVRHLET